jgi:MFS family permease
VLLGVYSKQNFAIPENQYGWIATTNALMVIFFQIPVTRISKRYPNLVVMIIGAIFYTTAVTSIAFGQGFWWFWGSMVVMTIGELLLMPTSSTFVANLAPPDKRGRYMGIYSLTALPQEPPTSGGFERGFGTRTIWFGAGLVGSIGILGFLILLSKQKSREDA